MRGNMLTHHWHNIIWSSTICSFSSLNTISSHGIASPVISLASFFFKKRFKSCKYVIIETILRDCRHWLESDCLQISTIYESYPWRVIICCNCFFQFVLTEVQRFLDQLPGSLNILHYSPDFILHCRSITYSGWSKTGAVLYGYNFGPSIDSHHRNCHK